jgi:toxin YoeB
VRIVFDEETWDDYLRWQQQSPQLCEKISELLRDIRRSPFRGLGKPEPLKGEFAGWWSRRIDHEHRLIYRIAGSAAEQRVEIAQCRWHYRR